MCPLICDRCVEGNCPKHDEELTSNGYREGFGELIRKHHATCNNIATLILRNSDQAKDEVQ